MSQRVWITGAVVAIFLIGMWWRSEIKAAEYRGQADLMAEQADSAFAALEDSAATWAARQAAYDSARQTDAAELDSLKATHRISRERASQVNEYSETVISRLRDSLETLTQADLDTIVAGIEALEASEQACNAALGRCETIVETADARIWELESQFRQSDALNQQQALVIERLQDLKPPAITPIGYLGYAVAGVLTVVLIVR